jgi:PAS domain S-box-containing protein
MAGGTGEAGREMLARGHTIPLERGLVGRAAHANAPVLVPDTAGEPGWLPNPLLPETKAEIAVPITIGETVLGVLDVQHNIVNGLTQEDVTLLQSIANQVAVAIQNARQYEQAREREVALSVSEERYRLFIQHSGEAIYELDFETKEIQNANQALLNLLGYELEEIRALKLYDIVAFGQDKIDIVLERVKQDKSLLVGETKWKRKDGTLVDVYVNMSAIQQGPRTFMLGQAFDISQRKQIQLALEKRAERDRVLNRISTKIRNAVSVEQILQVATQEMRQAVGAARSVAVIDPNEETVSLQSVSARDFYGVNKEV